MRTTWTRVGGRCLLAGVLLACSTADVSAQETVSFLGGDADLPDAPSMSSQGGNSKNWQTGTASIAGSVVDMSGAAIVGARVTLAVVGGQGGERTISSDGKGEFVFPNLPAGSFRVSVRSPGLETFASNEIELAAAKKFEVPLIELPIAPPNTEVQVMVTEQMIAQEQMKAAEKQRILGVIPNFYTSYIWNAAPLNSKQKFELSAKSTLDPVAFASVAILAGVEQAHNTFPGYGDGAEGYAKRFGAAFADRAVGRVLSSAILPTVFHQDPRYFYKGTGSIPSRAFYAASRAVVSKGDDGEWHPNYSHVLGNFAAAGISNLYRAREDRTASLTIRNGFIITGGNAITNLIREFISRKLSTNVPSYAQGQPVE